MIQGAKNESKNLCSFEKKFGYWRFVKHRTMAKILLFFVVPCKAVGLSVLRSDSRQFAHPNITTFHHPCQISQILARTISY